MFFLIFSLPNSWEKLRSVCLLLWKLFRKPHQISIPAFLRSRWSIFSSVHSYSWNHGRLSELYSESHADFGTTFRDTGGYQKAGTSSLKRVTGRIFKNSKCFIEASRNSIFYFLHKRRLIIVKTINAHSESTVSIVRTFKKYSSRDTVPGNYGTELRQIPCSVTGVI